MDKKKISFIVGGIVVLVAVFYGGVLFGKGQPAARSGNQAFTFNGGGVRGARNGLSGGGFTAGQIIAKDSNSITVQIMSPNGQNQGEASSSSGSKIIFLDNNTKVTKSAMGTLADLAVGTDVSITGTANTDGSISAESIQIRPTVQPPSQK